MRSAAPGEGDAGRQLGRVGDWSSATTPRQPPLIEPDVRFSLIRLSDGVHVVPVADQA